MPLLETGNVVRVGQVWGKFQKLSLWPAEVKLLTGHPNGDVAEASAGPVGVWGSRSPGWEWVPAE